MHGPGLRDPNSSLYRMFKESLLNCVYKLEVETRMPRKHQATRMPRKRQANSTVFLVQRLKAVTAFGGKYYAVLRLLQPQLEEHQARSVAALVCFFRGTSFSLTDPHQIQPLSLPMHFLLPSHARFVLSCSLN